MNVCTSDSLALTHCHIYFKHVILFQFVPVYFFLFLFHSYFCVGAQQHNVIKLWIEVNTISQRWRICSHH